MLDVLVTKKTYEWEEETDIPGSVVRRCGVASVRVPPSDLNLICDPPLPLNRWHFSHSRPTSNRNAATQGSYIVTSKPISLYFDKQ